MTGVQTCALPIYHKLKFKLSVFQSKICVDISLSISPDKLFYMFLKNLNFLACEKKWQDFGLSSKNCVIPQIHSTSHDFSPTKPNTHAYG